MRVLQVNFHPDPGGRAVDELLRAWPTLAHVAEAAAGAGAQVTVLQASAREAMQAVDGFTVRLAPPALLARWLDPAQADVVHVHGLSFVRQVRSLRRRHAALPLLLQDHADGVPRLWRRPAWKRALAAADALALCAAEQAEPFVAAGLLARTMPLFEIPESSSRFVPGDREAARAATGMQGDPALLWVGRLDGNKDPLTVLDAMALLLDDLPQLRLYLCHAEAPLLPALRARLAAAPRLAERVQLLGRVPHERVQTLMQAADFLVLGSHREGCSYATIEALASGLPPLVTDLPSMRRITGDGVAGALWPPGDAAALAALLRRLVRADRGAMRRAARERFEQALAPQALGRRWCAAYRACIEFSRRRRGAAAR